MAEKNRRSIIGLANAKSKGVVSDDDIKKMDPDIFKKVDSVSKKFSEKELEDLNKKEEELEESVSNFLKRRIRKIIKEFMETYE
jgi:hypothetical protein